MSKTADHLSRRAALSLVLVGLGAVPALAAKRRVPEAAPAAPYRKGATAFRSIQIDTHVMAEKGLPTYAERIRALAQPVVADVFADRLDPHAPEGVKLVLRIDSIDLREPGSRGHRWDMGSAGSGQLDWIEGVGIVVDAAGRVVANVPITTSADSSLAGPIATPQGELVRTRGLIDRLARWVKNDV